LQQTVKNFLGCNAQGKHIMNKEIKRLGAVGLIDGMQNQNCWCGFDDSKHPYCLNNIKGIGVDVTADRLGPYKQAKALGYPYVGISFTKPIEVQDKYLVCLDFDWKRSPRRAPEPEQVQLMQELDRLGAAFETSHSHLGAHYWIISDAANIPSRLRLRNECEIEVFSGFPGQVGNVLVTDFDATGSLITVDLTTKMPRRINVTGVVGNKPANRMPTEHHRAELLRALTFIDPTDYWIWLRVGMALKNELGDMGFNAWNDWSSADEKYDPTEMAYKWNSFAGDGVTGGTLIFYAQEKGFIYQHQRTSANDEFAVYIDPETGERITDYPNLPNIWSTRLVEPVEFMVATDWVIDNLISEKLTIVAGAPGIGKTTCLFGMLATAAGFKDINSPLKASFRRKILWVSEHPEQLQQLILAISKLYVDHDGHPLYSNTEINQWVIVVAAFRANMSELTELGYFALDYVVHDELGNAIEPLVVLDTANACLDLEDENKNSEVGKYVGTIKEGLIKKHIPVVLIAHTPKAVQKSNISMLSARGAGAFEGDAHATGFIFQDTEIGSRLFKLGKRRYRVNQDEFSFCSDSLLTTAVDRRGRTVMTEVDIAMPRVSSEASRAVMAVQTQTARQREAELAKIRDLEDKSLKLWRWLKSKEYVSVNEIRSAKLPGLTDKKMIGTVLDLMLDEGMATSVDGKRGGQKTTLFSAIQTWNCYR